MLLIYIPVVFLQGCSDGAHNEEEAQKIVDKFHRQFSAQQYSEIYKGVNDSFRNSIGEDRFIKFLSEALTMQAHSKTRSYKA